MLLHEDYPHTVPTRAYLRWKENYFWVFIDPASGLSCLAHCTTEPTYERCFASFIVLYKGKQIISAKEVPVPSPFEHQKELKFGGLTLRFLKPQEKFQLLFEDDVVSATLDFTARMKLFDFQACQDVNPDAFSISDNTAFAPWGFRHQGQCIDGAGVIRFNSGDLAGETVQVSGNGYRDHSWGMRNDALTKDHNWSFFNFPSNGFHLMRVRNIIRPESYTAEGYVAVPEGNEVIEKLTIENVGEGPDGMPDKVIYRAVALGGRTYTITADIGNAIARLPLHSQKPGKTVYFNMENICPCSCAETGEHGFADVEIGRLMDA